MSPEIVKLLLQGVEETIFMVAVSGIIATGIGIPLGILLVTTDKGHILENAPINRVFGTIVNIIRSVPFIILMVAIIPFTKLVAGTSIGTLAACVPLTIVAIPFLSRLVETSVRDIDYGLIEAAQSMGATPFKLFAKSCYPKHCLLLSTTLRFLSSALSVLPPWPVPSAAAVWGTLPFVTATSDSVRTSCWQLLSS